MIHKLHSVLMALSAALAAGVTAASVGAEKSALTGEIQLSGAVAKLIAEHRVTLISSLAPGRPAFVGRGKDFPIRLPTGDFDAAFLDVTDVDGKRVLAVLFDRPLFQDGSRAVIRLDEPTMELSIRQHGERTLRIQHWAWVAKKVCYSDMPYWDSKRQQLRCSASPDVELSGISEPGQPLVAAKMNSGCMGYGWIASLDIPAGVTRGETVMIAVRHETGDIWGRLSIAQKYLVK